jgi:hypothetical protein
LAPACGILVALCAVLAGWHVAPRPDNAGFDLRTGPSSSNVDNTSAASAGGADPAPPPSVVPHPGGREDQEKLPVKIGPVKTQTPEPLPAPIVPPLPSPRGGGTPEIDLPPLPEPSHLVPDDSQNDLPPLTVAPLAPSAEPSVFDRDLNRGDSTMTLKTLALPMALAAVLTVSPLASAGDVEKQTPEQMAKDIKELKEAQKKSADALMEQLKNIQDHLRSMEGVRRDVDVLKDTVQKMSGTLELMTQNNKATTTQLMEAQMALKMMRNDLETARAEAGKMRDEIMAHAATCDGLTAKVSQLQKKLDETSSRQAARIAETGTIRLFNTSLIPVSVHIKGKAYQLEPGESYVLDAQPLGPIDYEVLGAGLALRRTKPLTPDRPLDIEVYDLARGPIKTPR